VKDIVCYRLRWRRLPRNPLFFCFQAHTTSIPEALFTPRPSLGPHEIKNRGYRFCEGLQFTNVAFWDFTRVKLMSCKECSVEEYIATWLRSSRR
jgi:hypothetical protein